MDSVLEGMSQAQHPAASQGYIMALDSGTTSVRAILFDEFGAKVAQAQRSISIRYPQSGWVEQDPIEILSRQIACMIEVQFKSGIHSDRIKAVGITNQRETVVVWDRKTGQPIYNAVVWQCRRTASMVEAIAAQEGAFDLIRSKTGLIPDAYFSATKIAWILDNVDGAREMAETGELMCGTIDTWLIYNLTHGVVHATDYTNASRTMLFNIHTLDWDDELCELFRVPRIMLPDPRPSSGNFGRVSSDVMTNHPPIAGVAGDQQASLYGHCCFEPGSVKNTYGTGCFMLMNTGDDAVTSMNGLLTTIGIAEGGKVDYALEGSVFQAGSTIQWIRDELGLVEHAAETCAISQSVPDTGGCYVVPAFTGLGAPWWDSNARGVICGLTRDTDRARLVRAACESMAYQTYDILKAMEADSGNTLTSLEVDGGASNNEFIMQFQADLLGIPVDRCEMDETTALGAAYLAGLAVGFWEDREELISMRSISASYQPQMDEGTRDALLAGWHEAVKRTLA
ncbi:MAG: glycerol kinase GlpK [Atopobiaceae bacterium]|nr:glycerol kinase GlpK [Atopobiaceae bacterium]